MTRKRKSRISFGRRYRKFAWIFGTQPWISCYRQITVDGDPAEEILRCADRMNVDLIAMGSHGSTGVLRLLMGSVSKQVLDNAKCAVLIARIPDKKMVQAGLVER